MNTCDTRDFVYLGEESSGHLVYTSDYYGQVSSIDLFKYHYHGDHDAASTICRWSVSVCFFGSVV